MKSYKELLYVIQLPNGKFLDKDSPTLPEDVIFYNWGALTGALFTKEEVEFLKTTIYSQNMKVFRVNITFEDAEF